MPVGEPTCKRQMPMVVRKWDEVDTRLRFEIERWRRGETKNPLYLFGEPGTGKTCAALCVADTCSVGWYWHMRSLVDAKVKAKNGELYIGDWKVYESDFMDRLAGVELIIIDEIAKRERASDFEIEILHDTLSRREGRPTILIGNRPPDELSNIYDGAVASRVNCGLCFLVEGDDRRKGEVERGERHKHGWKNAWTEVAEPVPSIRAKLQRVGEDGTPEKGNVFAHADTREIWREWQYPHYKYPKWYKLVDAQWRPVKMPNDWKPDPIESDEYDEIPF